MRLHKRSAYVYLSLVLIMLLTAGLACSLGSNKDKKNSRATPTLSGSTTPQGTRTVTPTFSVFPTLTPRGTNQPFFPQSTPTQIVLRPTAIVIVPTVSTYPYDVRITFPGTGGQVAGFTYIYGSASHPNFLQYALEWGPTDNPNLWYPIPESPTRNNVVINGLLGYWDTTKVRDGQYQIRVHVWLRDGTHTYSNANIIRVSNTQPTAVPSPTPTLRPNRAPTISPIPSQQVPIGQSRRLVITTSDPDNDRVNLFVASSSTSVATAQVTATNEITITGVTAGTSTITVTANDNYPNGTASTAFIVTVQGQNRAPTITPVGNQTVEVGRSVDLPVTASDPDSDPLTITAASSDQAIVTSSVPSANTVRITGVAAGTANITITASDGKGGVINTAFQVVVGSPNLPPIVEPINAQTMGQNETRDMPYTASDPNGNQLTATATSDNESVVSASITAPGTLRLASHGTAGTATIRLNISDGSLAVETAFTVTVEEGNLPPTIDAIEPQTMSSDEERDVMYNAFDPNGDTLTATATSDNEGVVSASVTAEGIIHLVAHGPETATITVSITDGTNPAVTTSFTVSVAAANLPPTVDPIADQTLTVGQTVDVPYNAIDPEGATLNASAASDNTGVVDASVVNPGAIHLVGQSAGTANVTLTVDDGADPAVTVTFVVTVEEQPNTAPAIQAVGAQTVVAGETITVPISASDTEGDTITIAATSDNPGVAAATANGTDVVINGVSAGTANIFVDATDSKGAAAASISFVITVTGTNNAPVMEPVGDQSLTVGQEISVPVTVSDPDGNTIVLTAISQNAGVVTAQAVGTDTIVLQGIAEGVTVVDLTADDANGGVTTASFNVTVSSAQQAFDLMNYPILPNITPEMATTLQLTYQGGLGLGNQPGAFSKVGDEPADSTNFLAPFAAQPYDLGNYGSLQSTIDFYAGTPVRTDDPTRNSLNVDSLAADPTMSIDTLSQSAPAGTPCDAIGGGTYLACEFQLTHPSIALIMFDPDNIVGMPIDQFRSELQTLVVTTMSGSGVIPVFATIPAGSGHTTEEITDYNQAIVEVATQSGVPLWNLWRAMKERNITDPKSVAPEGPGVLTESALNYGYNVRNLTALQVLETVRQAAGIQ